MKFRTFSALLLFYICISVVPLKTSAQRASVSFQVFYDDLSPYGTWINSPQYGYVWMPNVSAGFTPYSTNGYWTFTDEGWTWVSSYPWGWAPFHYGRWYNDITYGPVWIPDNEWGPGWVSWRRSGSYYGWAAMGPGVSIELAYGSGYYDTYNQYTFVRCGYMGNRNIHNHYENRTNNVTIINNTTVINNRRVDQVNKVTYNAGPDRAEVEKHVGKPIEALALKASSKPGQLVSNKEMHIYRPQVQKNISSEHKPAPIKVADLKDVKPVGQRGPTSEPRRAVQPSKQHPLQPQQNTPPKRKEGIRQTQPSPSKNMDGEKQQPPARPAESQDKQPLRNDFPPHQNPNIPPNLDGEKQLENSDPPAQIKPTQQRQTRQSEPQSTQPQSSQPNREQPRQQQNREQPRQQPEQPKPQRVQPSSTQTQQNRDQPPQQSTPQPRNNPSPNHRKRGPN